MNISIFKKTALLVLAAFTLVACTKQVVNEYDINPVHVANQGGNKGNLKTDLQLVTIMYADVFGVSIPNEKIKGLSQLYASFGDKDIVIDRITQHFLSDPLAQIPTTSYMRLNLDQFITAAYERFYVRKPTEAELWYFKKILNENLEITSTDVFYALMTADEYKYY